MGLPRRQEIASLDQLRGRPCHRTQLFIVIAHAKFRIVAGAESEQFIDHELGLAALYLNPLKRSREYIGLRLVVDAVADADGGTKQLVDAFKSGGDIHAISQGSVAQPSRRPDIADKNVGAIEPDPYADSPA